VLHITGTLLPISHRAFDVSMRSGGCFFFLFAPGEYCVSYPQKMSTAFLMHAEVLVSFISVSFKRALGVLYIIHCLCEAQLESAIPIATMLLCLWCLALGSEQSAETGGVTDPLYVLRSRIRPQSLQIPMQTSGPSGWSGYTVHNLVGNGFHRELNLQISMNAENERCSGGRAPCCEIIAVQPLDCAIYADLDELQVSKRVHCDLGAHFVPKDLNRFGGAEPWSDNLHIDTEKPAHGMLVYWKKIVACCLQSHL
jgi:hypothetical protein